MENTRLVGLWRFLASILFEVFQSCDIVSTISTMIADGLAQWLYALTSCWQNETLQGSFMCEYGWVCQMARTLGWWVQGVQPQVQRRNDGWELRPQNGWNILKIIEICWIFCRPGPSWPQRKNWTQHAIMTCVPGALDACGLELNQPKENHATIAKQQRLLSCVSCTCELYHIHPYTSIYRIPVSFGQRAIWSSWLGVQPEDRIELFMATCGLRRLPF